MGAQKINRRPNGLTASDHPPRVFGGPRRPLCAHWEVVFSNTLAVSLFEGAIGCDAAYSLLAMPRDMARQGGSERAKVHIERLKSWGIYLGATSHTRSKKERIQGEERVSIGLLNVLWILTKRTGRASEPYRAL